MYALGKARSNWFETGHNNLCDNKNVKFHYFNPHKTQPLGASPTFLLTYSLVLVTTQKSWDTFSTHVYD